MGMTFEPKVLNVEQLEPFKIRDVRQSILDKIQERIEQAGYNPSRPLSVVQKNGKYIVADGNHRLEVIRKLGIQDVPCVVYQDDPYSIATKSNQDEDTYAPMDLFDWLDVIRKLQEDGLTQAKIGEVIGWVQQNVARYLKTGNLTPQVLSLAKKYQEGRGVKNTPSGVFDFTEGWFRNSGIYDLMPVDQMELMRWFVEDKKCDAKAKSVKDKAAELQFKRNSKIYVAKELMRPADQAKFLEIIQSFYSQIDHGYIKSHDQLEKLVNKKNVDWEDENRIKIIHADVFDVIDNYQAGTFDLLIADPPYKVLSDEWDTFKNKDEFIQFTERWLKRVMPKIKDTGRAYIFFSQWYEFDLYEVLRNNDFFGMNFGQKLIWYYRNNNQPSNRKEYRYCYEPIFYLYGKNAGELNFTADTYGDDQMNVWEEAMPQSNFKEGKNHPAQKPLEIYRKIIKTGSKMGDAVLDPFAGSGTTGCVCKELNREVVMIEKDLDYCKLIQTRLVV